MKSKQKTTFFNQIRTGIGKSATFQSFLTLFTGTAISQVIMLLLSPVLARLFTPEQFGDLAVYTSIVALGGLIATGRLELAILLPKEERQAEKVVLTALLLTVIISVVVFFGILIFRSFIANFLGDKDLMPYFLILIPISIFFSGFSQTFNYWNTRVRKFDIISGARISRSVSLNGTSILFYFSTLLSKGLILGQFIAFIVEGVYMYRFSKFKISKAQKDFNWNSFITTLKEYRHFIYINTPQTAIDSGKEQGVIFLISSFFSNVILGYYSFTIRILRAPFQLIGSSLYQVVYQKIMEMKTSGLPVQPYLLKVYGVLILTALPLFLLLYVFIVDLFSLIFGSEWEVAGHIARLLMPWLFFHFLAAPVSSIALVANKQHIALRFSIADLLLRFGSLYLGYVMMDYQMAFLSISITTSVLLIIALSWYYRIANF